MASDTVGREVPGWLQPALGLYGLVGASVVEAVLQTARALCRVEVCAEGPLPARCVLCYWHRDALLGFVYVLGLPTTFAALCHPHWRLKPWEVLARWHRWRLVAASSGNDGQRGARAVAEALCQGCSTFVCPDGPAGPPGTLRRGALHMAAQGGVPVVPLRFRCALAVALPGWDRMRLPLPGATVTVLVGAPIPVADADLDAAAQALGEALGEAR